LHCGRFEQISVPGDSSRFDSAAVIWPTVPTWFCPIQDGADGRPGLLDQDVVH
jgi:hypothetical protein